jgi:hypothetical protein
MHRTIGTPPRELLGALLPPLLCACVMAGAGFALDHEVVRPERYAIIPAIVLLAGESVLLLAFYVALVRVVFPARGRLLIGGTLELARRRLGRRPVVAES